VALGGTRIASTRRTRVRPQDSNGPGSSASLGRCILFTALLCDRRNESTEAHGISSANPVPNPWVKRPVSFLSPLPSIRFTPATRKPSPSIPGSTGPESGQTCPPRRASRPRRPRGLPVILTRPQGLRRDRDSGGGKTPGPDERVEFSRPLLISSKARLNWDQCQTEYSR
jgi:hypothetical protein